MANASQEQKVLLELFQKFHVQAGLSITEIREITAKVFVELEVRQRPNAPEPRRVPLPFRRATQLLHARSASRRPHP
jgi:hypothetical protein